MGEEVGGLGVRMEERECRMRKRSSRWRVCSAVVARVVREARMPSKDLGKRQYHFVGMLERQKENLLDSLQRHRQIDRAALRGSLIRIIEQRPAALHRPRSRRS